MLFDNLADNGLVGIFEVTDGRLAYANPAFQKLFGYEQHELLGQDPLTLVHPEDRPGLAAKLGRLEGGSGRSISAELRGVRKNGEIRHFQTFGRLSVVDGHRLMVGLAVDVTERVQAEKAGRESEERLHALIDHAPVAIGVSRVGTTVWVNEAYLQLFGCKSQEELVGRPLTEQIAPAFRPQIMDLSRRRAGGMIVPTSYDSMGLRSDGTEFPMHVAVSEVEFPDGPTTIGFLTDMTRLKQAQMDLAFEASVESALLDALHQLPTLASAEVAANILCDALWVLPEVAFAAVFAFGPGDDFETLAQRSPFDWPHAPRELEQARRLSSRAAMGPHAEYWDGPTEEVWETQLKERGLAATAYAPIFHGDHLDGLLMVGTCDQQFARVFVERLPSVVDFTGTSSALLAERLHVRREEIETRGSLRQTIERREFYPVFQPIVDLNTGTVVGHEALTRFASGQRPDLCFADAWRLGLGPDLELATMSAAIAAARHLPPATWLDLNVSPRLLADQGRLRAVLSHLDRPVVLEITEHEPIDDYPTVRERLRSAHSRVRIAVDDAGAGMANFTHLVELRPEIVKLDMSLVRQIDVDLGRQAMVTGMRHFATSTGCRLVAEGVETEQEAGTLRHLGVELGQGYFFGRPEPVTD